MKSTLSFNLPEEHDDLMNALQAPRMSSALFEISQQVFRPARKHGYSDPELAKLAEGNEELIAKLEELFSQIIQQHEINEYL
jgi:hypothetical protein